LRRKRNQEKRRRSQPAEVEALQRSNAAAKMWQQFVGIGQMMRTTQAASKQAKQQVQLAAADTALVSRQFRTQAKG
jgi:hypothetical protein